MPTPSPRPSNDLPADTAEPADSASWANNALGGRPTTPDSGRASGEGAPSTRAAPSYYLLTHSPAETVRQEQQHWFFYEALGDHHLAAMPVCPLPANAWILDVGCGDGYWLRDVLREWPQAIGIGVDLAAPTNPTAAFSPPARAIFVAGNLVSGLPFADGAFYLVHQRMLGAALPRKLWPAALAELVRVTAPGGWIECLEGGPVEDIPASCPAVRRLQEFTDEFGAQRGIELAMNARLGELLGATDGLDQASIYVYNIPLMLTLQPSGNHVMPWSAAAARNWLAARQTLAPKVVERGLTDANTHAELMRQAEYELSTYAVRWPIHVAYARRKV